MFFSSLKAPPDVANFMYLSIMEHFFSRPLIFVVPLIISTSNTHHLQAIVMSRATGK